MPGLSLRPATLDDRRAVYEWLAESDLTTSMAGPPTFPEIPVPTWDEFRADYVPSFFDDSDSESGRSYIIELDEQPIGHISHSQTDLRKQQTELDIWLCSSEVCGQGFGTRALEMLTQQLQTELRLMRFVIRPSARNPRAIRSYEKAGFAVSTDPKIETDFGPGEFADTLTMLREISAP